MDERELPIEAPEAQGPRPLACADCDHARWRTVYYLTYVICAHPRAAVIVGNKVHGYTTRPWRAAPKMREDGAPCGPAAALWVPRRSAIRRWLDWWGR